MGGGATVRPPKQLPSSLPYKPSHHHHHHQKFVEEVKPSLKSGPGPGPGPGPGSKPPPHDRLVLNHLSSSSSGGGGSGRGRPRSADKVVKDPQVQKIMSEMSDLKSPLSAILQTPRPDHQSSFTFPAPANPPGNREPSSGFREPSEPQCKSGKSSDVRIPPVTQSKTLENSLHEEFPLTEESDDEVRGDSRPDKSEASSIVNASAPSRASSHHIESVKEPPLSPTKNTDESSNSEYSSGTDSETSTTTDGKQSPAPASPLPSDKNPWSLESIFQQSNKEESLVHESGLKNSDSTRDIKPESMPPSPQTVNEPAPPVITTIPVASHPKKSSDTSKGASRPLSSPTTSEESSDEELQPSLKAKKLPASRPSYGRSKGISPSKVKKIVEPVLSSDSEDEAGSLKGKRNLSAAAQPPSRSPKIPPPPLAKSKYPVVRKPPKKRDAAVALERIKSVERVDSDVDLDSDDDDDSNDASQKRYTKRVSSTKPSTPSKQYSRKLTNGDVLSHLKSPSKLGLENHSSPATPAGGDDRRKHSHRDSKHNGELRKEERSEKEAKSLRSSVLEAHSLSKKVKKEEEEVKVEKRRRKSRKHQTELDASDKGAEGGGIHKISEEEERVKYFSVSPVSRQSNTTYLNSYNNNNKASFPNVQYENGVPKLLCSIPFNLIDKLPSKEKINSSKGCAREEKVNKEVLEMRTSSGRGKGKNKNSYNKSPPNEDETKLRAISLVYKKRQSSLEPDKIKREVKSEINESHDVKAPHIIVPKVEEHHVKSESKNLVKEEIKGGSSKSLLEVPLERHGSSSSLSSMGTVASVGSHSHSKKHKKDKRKDRESSTKEKALESEVPSKRRKRTKSPDAEAPQKKSRESSRESTTRRSSSRTSNVAQGNQAKKLKTSHEEENQHILTPREQHLRDGTYSPHYRGSQRSTNEERPPSVPAAPDPIQAPHPSRPKQPKSSSSQCSRKGSSLVISPFLEESEDDVCVGEGSHRVTESYPLSRDKSTDDTTHAVIGGDTSEYDSLLSSEHGCGSTYKNDDHSSPHLGLGPAPQQQPLEILECGQMYPPEIDPSPGPSIECNSALGISQEVVTGRPVYVSYFERPIPEISKDNTQYLNTAKELKHLADKEPHRVLQTIIYLEAVLYFILTGESMESDPNTYGPSYTMYNDTFKLIRHVSSPIFKSPGLFDKKAKDGPYNRLNVILAILSLRCQSLLAQKLYCMKRNEMKEVQRVVCDFLKVNVFQGGSKQPPSSLPASTPVSSCAGGGTPVGVAWGGSQRSAANNSPSSLSPTPSPAGSVGSEGSQSSSGYSTEGTRQRSQHPPMGATPPQGTPMISVPPDVHATMVRHCHLTFALSNCHDMWKDADEFVYRHDMKNFFIELDRSLGPLTLHSSLMELVKYVQTALDKLKKQV